MRTYHKSPIEYRRDVPLSCVQMAERRTEPMIAWYGHYVREISLQTLVASAYLQGVEDMHTYYEKNTQKPTMGAQNAIPLALGAGDMGVGGI
jgi:hypothetical protein